MFQKIKHLTPSAHASTPLLAKERGQGGEVYSFDESGHIVRFSFVRKFFLGLVIVLVALLAFGIGRLSVEGKREPVRIVNNSQFPISNLQSNSNDSMNNENSMKIANSQIENLASVYASSKGTKYYYSHCRSTVSEKNKVIFATAEMAESAGYTLSATCRPN